MSFNLQQALARKRLLRERLAARPIAEKLRLLDAMRERAVTLRLPHSHQAAILREPDPDYGK